MTCDLCKATIQKSHGKYVHERMMQVGLTERVTRSPRTKPTWVTRFRCEVCGALWRHEDDTQTGRAAWLAERDPAPV